MASVNPSRLALLSLLLANFIPTQVAAQAAVAVETDGFVFFEAESGTLANGDVPIQSASSNWLVGTELSNFSGDAYLEWAGPNLFDGSGAGQDIINYRFEITSPGNYELRWRTRIAKGDSNTESNDTWARFPSGVNVAGEEPMSGWTKVYMGHSGAWFWDAKVNDHVGANTRQYFSAGTHTLQISGRSNGHAVDKIALYKYEELSLSPFDLDIRSGTPQNVITANEAEIASEQTDSSSTTEDQQGSVLEVATGVQYAPGECANNTLALAPIADVHLLDTQVFNLSSLQLAPEPARSLLAFDLTGVVGASTAEIQMTIDGGDGVSRLNYYLTSAATWVEYAAGMNPAPENLLQLGTGLLNWNTGKRYAFSIDPSNLTSDVVSLSIDAENMPSLLSVASRENSLQMPLMVFTGPAGFCDSYIAATGPDENDVPDTDGNSGDDQGSSNQDASGQGVSDQDSSNQGSDSAETQDQSGDTPEESLEANNGTTDDIVDGVTRTGGGVFGPLLIVSGLLLLVRRKRYGSA